MNIPAVVSMLLQYYFASNEAPNSTENPLSRLTSLSALKTTFEPLLIITFPVGFEVVTLLPA